MRHQGEICVEEFFPRLRSDIEFIPLFIEGKKSIIVRDHLGLIKEPLLLWGEILDLISLLDGKHNLRDIQYELVLSKKGVFISSEEVMKIISELDAAFLLESERYREAKKEIIIEYGKLKERSAFHEGRAYPGNLKELRAYLDSILQSSSTQNREEGKVMALVAPHIDLEVGKKVYGKAYQSIKNSKPRRILLLGVGHNLHEYFFSLTEKDFRTLYGVVHSDREFIKELRKAGGSTVSQDDIVHRCEHSLEFQLLFLQHIFGSDFMIVPLLCGSFQKVLQQVRRPADIEGVSEFLTLLRQWIEENPSETIIVSGIDLSHIGPKFGHNQTASSLLEQTKKHDKLLIESVLNLDLSRFWEMGKMGNNFYNVCGFSTLACLLELLRDVKGHFLCYDIWQEERTKSAVSFAALVFYKR